MHFDVVRPVHVHNNNVIPRQQQQQQQQIVVDEDVEEKHNTIDRDFKQSFGSAGEEQQKQQREDPRDQIHFRVIEETKIDRFLVMPVSGHFPLIRVKTVTCRVWHPHLHV